MITEQQAKAIDFLMTATTREVGLTGWAGTGKTYTTARYIAAVQDEGLRVVVLAPTHRACGVLRAELAAADVDVPVMTVHAGCGLVPSMETKRNEERGEALAGGADIVVVDEASMVDAALLAKIRKLKATRIVYVGDPYQLSPVSDGKGTPAFEGLDVARLTETKRYKPGSVLDELTGHLRRCIDAKKAPNVTAIESAFARHRGGLTTAARLLEEGGRDDGVIVCYRNAMAFAACAMVQGGASYRWQVGDPVTFLSPWSYESESRRKVRVHSGTEGVVAGMRESSGDGILVEIEYHGGGRGIVPAWKADRVAAWMELRKAVATRYRSPRKAWLDFVARTPALDGVPGDSAREVLEQIERYACLRQTWATTAHKAQGGSYDRVIVMWDDMLRASRDPELLSRLLYVAATRVRSVDNLFFVRGDV